MDNEVKRVHSFQLFELAEDMLADGQSVIITVVGNSMYPFLRNGIDSVELYRESYDKIRVSDIVVAKTGRKYILHRIYKKYDDKFIMLGDGNFQTDRPYLKEDLVCKASAIYRKYKRISCKSLSFKFLSSVWKMLKPFRAKIFKLYFKIKRK